FMKHGLGITDEKLDEIVRPILGDGFFQEMEAVELFSLVAAAMTGSAFTKYVLKMFRSPEPIKVLAEGVEQAMKKKIPPKVVGSKQVKKKVDTGVKKAGNKLKKEADVNEGKAGALDIPTRQVDSSATIKNPLDKEALRIYGVSKFDDLEPFQQSALQPAKEGGLPGSFKIDLNEPFVPRGQRQVPDAPTATKVAHRKNVKQIKKAADEAEESGKATVKKRKPADQTKAKDKKGAVTSTTTTVEGGTRTIKEVRADGSIQTTVEPTV
ncbi:unnamed protein product, partial [marine sediment metagenome]